VGRRIFLSHSGIDAEAAAALKVRILAVPAAREHGLNVWLDKDDLRAGEPWQSQIEEAIGKSQAFAVYVGSRGMVNWVEAEVRLALNRAISEPEYRFVPILAATAPGPEALPGFAQQFQAVFDVEARADQFDRLMGAVLGGAEAGRLQLETEPFFGLRAIDEHRSHLFFGREAETDALVARVHRTPLVLVTGDSGSGKSSLVRAGLVPRFRGGALAVLDGARPEDAIWHVVTAQPRNQPLRQLGDAIDGAAKSLGLPLADRGALADWAASGKKEKVRRGLRCDLPPERVQVLLVVDQFEELLTVTPPELRAPFIDLLLDLSDPAEGRHRVVLTMRHDYANLCNAYERLRERLDADDRRGRFLLGRMSDKGLRRVVTEPLRLAAVEPADREALARQVLRDVGERPGDLALVQMALTETWHARSRHGGDLLRAYIDVGRVEGALAKAAESVRANVLDDEERELLDSILLRLVRLGDTGGATRRVASRSEFDAARWLLVQKLTSDDGKRLVLVGGSSEHPRAEIAHEALVTAWPHFQGLLQQAPDDKRTLDALIPRAAAWAAHEDPREREKRLATGADLELFEGLLHRRATWLSGDERDYVERSAAATKARQRRRSLLFKGAVAASVLFLLVAMGAIALFFEARAQRDRATALSFEARAERDRSERAARFASETLASLRATESLQPGEAVSLGLQALRSATDEQQELAEAALLRALFAIRSRSLEGHAGAVNAVALSRDGARAVTGSSDACAIVWDLSNGRQVTVLRGHSSAVHAVDFDPEGRRVLTASTDGTARVWDAVTGEPVATAEKSEALVVAAFNPDGDSYATGSEGGAVAVRETMTGRLIVMLAGHRQRITALAFNSGGDRIVTASEDGSVTVWQSRTGEMLLDLVPQPSHTAVTSAEFSHDGNFIVTASHNGRVRIWDSQDGHLQAERHSHQGMVQDVEFSSDGRLVVSAGDDGSALVWAWATDEVLSAFTGHQGRVYSVDFSADGRRVVSAADDGSVRVWDATSGALEETVSWHQGTVWGAAFAPAGDAVVSWSADGKVNLSPRSVTSLVGHTAAVYTLALSPSHPVVATASADGTARLWSIADGATLHVLGDQDARPAREIWQAAFSPTGDRLITAGSDGVIQVWDTASGHLLQEDRRPGAQATDALFGAGGAPIVGVYDDGLVRWWPAGDLEGELEDLGQHGRAVQEVQFSPDGEVFLTISWDGTAILWDSATGKERQRLEVGAVLTSAAFSPDGQRIATASMDGTARIWNTASAELLTRLRPHGGPLAKVAFSSDGTRLATASWDNTARIWDAHTFEPLAQLGGHRGRVQSPAFFDDGRIVATTSWDGSTRLWHLATGLQLAALEGHRGIVHAVAIGPDGSWLATASQDGTARLWALPYVNGMDVEAAARDVLAGQAAHEPACTAQQ
jgi:WD40 repeat protein/energy-coupling factor transporter ATP-binding protein EcfA2